jgi:hypothetical protein
LFNNNIVLSIYGIFGICTPYPPSIFLPPIPIFVGVEGGV